MPLGQDPDLDGYPEIRSRSGARPLAMIPTSSARPLGGGLHGARRRRRRPRSAQAAAGATAPSRSMQAAAPFPGKPAAGSSLELAPLPPLSHARRRPSRIWLTGGVACRIWLPGGLARRSSRAASTGGASPRLASEEDGDATCQ
jgi:hypothetical protein